MTSRSAVLKPPPDAPEPRKASWQHVRLSYPRGVSLFRQGDQLPAVWRIASGTVKLTHIDDNSRESIVALALPGDWVGSSIVLAEVPAPVSAITCSETFVESCPADVFRQLLHDNAGFSAQIHRIHAEELCRQATRIGQLCSLNSRGRLLAALYRFAAPDVRHPTGAVRIDLPLHRWELAELIGVTAEHLSRLFTEIDAEGLIRRDKGWIIVRDVQRLRQTIGAS